MILFNNGSRIEYSFVFVAIISVMLRYNFKNSKM